MAAKEPLLLYTHPETGELLRRRWELEVIDGNDRGTVVPFDYAPALIGAAPAAMLVISDDTVSRYHAELDAFADGIRVRDLDSTNGTFVGEERIRDAFVEAGQEFRVGRTTVRTRAIDEPAAPEIDTDPHGVPIGAVEHMKDALAVAGSTRDLLRSVGKIARSSSTVLFEGERGSGRATLAKLLHDLSPRQNGPFVVIEPRLLSDVGEVEMRLARALEQAKGGTIFIEDIESIPESLQLPLLMTIESGEVQRPGDEKKLRIDVRIVSSTTRALAEDPSFLPGLFRRIAVVHLKVPALRERREDIPALAEHFMKAAHETPHRLGPRVSALLRERDWPGNADELREAVRGIDELATDSPIRTAIRSAFITDVVTERKGHVSEAARALGMSDRALFRFLKTTGVDLDAM